MQHGQLGKNLPCDTCGGLELEGGESLANSLVEMAPNHETNLQRQVFFNGSIKDYIG